MTFSTLLKLLLLWLLVSSSFAAIEEREFTSVDEEQRYQQFIKDIRCPQCLNASIAGSDAPIAADLRREVYEQMREGQSDDAIMAFLKDRYGEFISYSPPLNLSTVLLWFGPLLLLLAGFLIVRRMLSGMKAVSTEASLSDDEQARLQAILNETESGNS